MIEREGREGYQPCPQTLCSQSSFTGDLDAKDEKYIFWTWLYDVSETILEILNGYLPFSFHIKLDNLSNTSKACQGCPSNKRKGKKTIKFQLHNCDWTKNHSKQNGIELNPKPKPTNHKFKKYLWGCRAFCSVKTQSQVKCIPRRTHRKQIATNNHKSTENNK